LYSSSALESREPHLEGLLLFKEKPRPCLLQLDLPKNPSTIPAHFTLKGILSLIYHSCKKSSLHFLNILNNSFVEKTYIPKSNLACKVKLIKQPIFNKYC